MKIIFNASPLIYLGKKRRVELLKILFEKIMIPSEVEREIMRLPKSPEAVQLQEAIEEGWIF